MIGNQDASAGIIRTISHDFKEPLRSVRWYLKKLRESSDMDDALMPFVDEYDEIVRYTQEDFHQFYESYKEKRIALPEFRSFIRTTLGKNMRILEANWQRLYPPIQSVKFIDPKMARYPDISVTSLNETVKRILRRYDGLLRYLDVRNEPARANLGLHNEVSKVIGDLKAIIATERAEVLTSGSLTAKFDQTLASLIFQNLIVNSIKYRSPHRAPHITIVVGSAAVADLASFVPLELRDRLDGAAQAGFVVYSDNGRGIPADFVQTAFHPFIQVDPADSAGGSGMGLAIVRTAVEAHDGLIWLRSRLGAGTTFVMLFPVESPSETRLCSREEARALFDVEGGIG